MRFLVAASMIFYALVLAAALDYGIAAYRCDCRPPAPDGIAARFAIYYGIALVGGIALSWRG